MKVEVETDPKRIAQMRAGLASYHRNSDAMLANHDGLLASYPEEWVTMHDGCIYHAPTVDLLLKQLESAGIDTDGAPMEFMGRDQAPLLL